MKEITSEWDVSGGDITYLEARVRKEITSRRGLRL